MCMCDLIIAVHIVIDTSWKMLGFHSYVFGRLKVSEVAEVCQGELELFTTVRAFV